ncbi:MAG: hypothetical protein A3J93_04290 [Candidatus Magasanikbacteria bacterium RIFOXYC2_FULL_42_28]|uniref:PEP-utilising enzyme mobile domain-containing protein n=1 Tax=Candidatus Magasanikbacteria bacterium RIFOXYC2_FULL_42_28 TaxID=1798704 RepID=A0A1F6NXS1_9BACT|nr:MAG: hypothetical protein A3J93_04290 [Candidatus Magasanikbacteria bacterium RIFOXYC2_FULL_42_28]
MLRDYIFKQRKENVFIFPNVYVIGHVFTYGLKNVLRGKSFGETRCVYRDNVMYWYASSSQIKSSAEELIYQLKSDPNLIKKNSKLFTKLSNSLLTFVKNVSTKDLSKFSNAELSQFWKQYLQMYEAAYICSEPLVILLEEKLSPLLFDYLKKLINGDRQDYSAMYNILVSPAEKSFVKREEDDLTKLALKIRNNKIKNKKLVIKNHTRQYFWVPFDYGMYIWNEKYFTEVLRLMIKNPKLAEKIKSSEKYFKNLSIRQRGLEKELKISPEYRAYFKIMRQGGYLMDYKKEIFTQVHFWAERILAETGRRLGIKRELVQYYLPQEVFLALKTGKIILKEILEQRQKHCYVWWQGKNIDVKLNDPDARMAEYLLPEEVSTGKLDGIIASAGFCSGKVKVLHSANEVNKVEQGDILVASMTSPDYVPAMRRAGAIITDEGGVMCHAAIVSRELGIPCVVGTKFATKLLKDGDLVEVNANHNSVRIIRK